MKVWHLLAVLLSAALAGAAVWQTTLHQRQADADAALQEIRGRGIPANLVRFPESGNLLLEAGMAWDEQPAEWRSHQLERLRAAHGASHIWRTDAVPYRDGDGQLLSAESQD